MKNQCNAASTAAVAATAQHAASKIFDLLIVGGGLSGLFVAHDYHHRQVENTSSSTSTATATRPSWKLLEARPVLGGRLCNDDKGHQIDLGGAWIWPRHQPNLRHLLRQLNRISTFPQPDDSSSTRIEGGAVSLIHALESDLPHENILLNMPVTKCIFVRGDENDESEPYIQVEAKLSSENEVDVSISSTATIFKAKQVVIAAPPKLVSKHIEFDPPLSPQKQKAMEQSHTWMAGVTKISLVYPTKFWKDTEVQTNIGLPSHMGPAFQAYDASTKDDSVTAAITFFTLVPPHSKATKDDKILAELVTHQLAQVWKYFDTEESLIQQLKNSYTDIHVQRWPLEEYISEDPKPQRIHPHPHPIKALSAPEWDGKLLFAGSESDLDSPGVMEGAIGAALRVLQNIPP